MLLVAVGTGVGGGVVVDGEVLTGAHAVGGHIGHMTAADAAAVPCTCGGVGHLEAIASGPAVLAAYLRERADGADVARAPADTREVVRRADAGDRLARHVLETAGRAAGSTIGSLVAALDPEVVVLSGGMAQAGPIWRDALDRGFAQAVMPVLSDVPLREAAAGESAALLGAAAYAWGAIGPESGPEPDATPSDPEETP
jgi:glucokinase